MKLVSINTPQSDRDLALWMEQTIVSEDFAQWLAELDAVRRVDNSKEEAPSYELLIADRFAQILDFGLISLSIEQMRLLLANPELLLELQRQIFMHESDYWTTLLSKQVVTPELERQRTNIALHLGPQAVVLARKNRDGLQTASAKRFSLAKLISAVAAVVILSLVGYWAFSRIQQGRAIAAQWNWQAEIKAIPIHTPKEYFETLAEQAEGWFQVRAANMTQLKTRIAKLKSNLDSLTDPIQIPIQEADRKWLEQHSLVWQQRCDKILSSDNFSAAVDDADAMCVQIIDELHRRSDSFNR